MFYRKNVGVAERVLRAVAGGLMVIAAFILFGPTLRALALGSSGVFVILTGLVGFCPACAMLGRRQLPR
jgi:hypothetical protein